MTRVMLNLSRRPWKPSARFSKSMKTASDRSPSALTPHLTLVRQEGRAGRGGPTAASDLSRAARVVGQASRLPGFSRQARCLPHDAGDPHLSVYSRGGQLVHDGYRGGVLLAEAG